MYLAGTGNGVIISVPLQPESATGNGGASGKATSSGGSGSGVVGSTASGTLFNRGHFIPRCHMANAQLSFHGHRDAVKFFVSVPMVMTSAALGLGGGGDSLLLREKLPDMLVVSSGEGYIDFRLGEYCSWLLYLMSRDFVWHLNICCMLLASFVVPSDTHKVILMMVERSIALLLVVENILFCVDMFAD